MLTLYDYELSGNCYKLRLFMNILGVKYETKSVDFYPGREHKSEWFLKINPLGQLPVLQDGDLVLRDAQAILVYLAARYDQSGLWYPLSDAAALGRVSMWLAFADAITATASAARLHDGLFYDIDINVARAGAHKFFRILDEHLWFAEREVSSERRASLSCRVSSQHLPPSRLSAEAPKSLFPRTDRRKRVSETQKRKFCSAEKSGHLLSTLVWQLLTEGGRQPQAQPPPCTQSTHGADVAAAPPFTGSTI